MRSFVKLKHLQKLPNIQYARDVLGLGSSFQMSCSHNFFFNKMTLFANICRGGGGGGGGGDS